MNELKYRLAAVEAAEDGLQSGEVVRFQVNGNSMRPYLKAGDWLLVRGVSTTDIGFGDILIVKRTQDVVAHRVIGQGDDGWITKGDAMYQADPVVKPEAILGVVSGIMQREALIDLTTKRRKFVHRLVASLSLLEYYVFERGKKVQMQIGKNRNHPWAGKLLRAIFIPFRLLARLFTP